MFLVVAAAAAKAGPTWLGVVGAIGIGSVLSSLITGFFLRSQTERQERRDDERLQREQVQRQHDREEESRRRAEERANDLEDHWRDQRHQAHVTLLGEFYRVIQIIGRSIHLDQGIDDIENVLGSLQSALADVMLLGGEASMALAYEANGTIRRALVAEMVDARIKPDEPGYERRIQSRGEKRLIADIHVAQYRHAVRKELGVTAGLPPEPESGHAKQTGDLTGI